jgi:putative ABC transport system permease protein
MMMNRNAFRWVLLKRALQQKKGKALLIVLATAMGASVVTALLSLEVDLRYRMNRELRDYGPNVLLVADPKLDSLFLSQGIVDALENYHFQNEIISYAPQLFVPARVNESPVTLVGTPLDSLKKLYPNWKLSVEKTPESGVLVGIKLARRMNLKEGSRIKILIHQKMNETKVAGIVETGESEDDRIFASLQDAQKWSGLPEQFHLIAVSAIGEIPGVEKDFQSFVSKNPGVSFQIVRKIAVGETVILDKISRLISVVILIILVTLFFCINTTVSAILLSRQGEIALFRVLGARRRQILFELTMEQGILGLIGGFAGCLLGFGMAQVLGQVLFQTFVQPHFLIFIVAILASLILLVLSTLFPIHRAVNREAALVLKEA